MLEISTDSATQENFSAYGRRPGQALVADREADIYPSWASVPDTNFHMLGRAMKDRLLAGGGTLFAAAATFPMARRCKIELRSHEPAHPKRTAVAELRYGEVEICRPQDERDHSLPPTVRLS